MIPEYVKKHRELIGQKDNEIRILKERMAELDATLSFLSELSMKDLECAKESDRMKQFINEKVSTNSIEKGK